MKEILHRCWIHKLNIEIKMKLSEQNYSKNKFSLRTQIVGNRFCEFGNFFTQSPKIVGSVIIRWTGLEITLFPNTYYSRKYGNNKICPKFDKFIQKKFGQEKTIFWTWKFYSSHKKKDENFFVNYFFLKWNEES